MDEQVTHYKGELVPVILQITSETEPSFTVIPTETICEILSTNSSKVIETIPVTKISDISGNTKKLYITWDTSNIPVGYYQIRFWVAISLFGLKYPDTDRYIIDAKLLSDSINKCIKNI